MPRHEITIEQPWTDEADCFECGIKLQIEDITEIEGENLCDQCAEEHLRESATHDLTSSVDDSLPERGARFH